MKNKENLIKEQLLNINLPSSNLQERVFAEIRKQNGEKKNIDNKNNEQTKEDNVEKDYKNSIKTSEKTSWYTYLSVAAVICVIAGTTFAFSKMDRANNRGGDETTVTTLTTVTSETSEITSVVTSVKKNKVIVTSNVKETAIVTSAAVVTSTVKETAVVTSVENTNQVETASGLETKNPETSEVEVVPMLHTMRRGYGMEILITSPPGTFDYIVSWSSSNDSIAIGKGEWIVARSVGKARMTATTANGHNMTIDVQVIPIDFDYIIQNEEVKITKYIGENESKEVNIPSGLEDGQVIEIGEGAFYGISKINEVVLPEKIKIIGDSAFEDCSSLKSINLSDSICSIGKSAFKNCKLLSSINIPASMINIENGTFDYCESLSSLNIPNNIKRIEETAFANCTGIKSLTIGSGVEYIGVLSFAGVNAEEIIIPENVQLVDDYAFKGCVNLKRMIFKNPNITFGENIFQEINAENITLIGYENSTAKAYAEKYGYKFELLQ